MSVAVRLSVKGRVQRVGFRRYVLDLAQEMGLTGYVRNLSDGSVEVFVQGSKDTVREFIEALKRPPPPVVVREIREELVELKPGLGEFKVLYGDLAEELQEGFGAMQAVFMEYWREFRDYRQEFRDFARRTDENFRVLFEKYGEISDKLTVILETLVKESKETREQLAKTIDKLTDAVNALKKACLEQ